MRDPTHDACAYLPVYHLTNWLSYLRLWGKNMLTILCAMWRVVSDAICQQIQWSYLCVWGKKTFHRTFTLARDQWCKLQTKTNELRKWQSSCRKTPKHGDVHLSLVRNKTRQTVFVKMRLCACVCGWEGGWGWGGIAQSTIPAPVASFDFSEASFMSIMCLACFSRKQSTYNQSIIYA